MKHDNGHNEEEKDSLDMATKWQYAIFALKRVTRVKEGFVSKTTTVSWVIETFSAFPQRQAAYYARYNRAYNNIIEFLNFVGQDGWELVQILSSSSERQEFYFKNPY